ncbi:hypothetical protein [Brevundimonas diminuta]|uniref:hypothetical protein n=1 Tax=Brevundimonas diminuta TaxID=293 RepID=UPI00320B9188
MTTPKPETMSPREKVARAIQAHDNDHVPDGYANGLSDEVSDWSAYLADRVLTALASGSGDHAELALNAKAAQTWALGIYENRDQADRRSKFIDSDLPATVLALIAEVAVLTEDLNRKHQACQIAQDQALENGSRATEAERKLAEARELLGAVRDQARVGYGEKPVLKSKRVNMPASIWHQIRTFLSSTEAERG